MDATLRFPVLQDRAGVFFYCGDLHLYCISTYNIGTYNMSR
jgi:hypothetical protein